MSVAVRSTASLAYGAARTSSAVPKPTGAASGDLLFCILDLAASGMSAVAVTPPTGWTEFSGSPSLWASSVDNFTVAQRLFTRLADGTEGTTFSFSHASAGTEAVIYALTGADTTTPLSAIADSYSNHINTGKTTNYGSLTTTANGAFIIASEHDWDAVGTAAPSGTTPTLAQRYAGTLLYVADGAQTTAGATSARTRTNGNGSNSSGWASFLIAVNPATGGGSSVGGTGSSSGTGAATGTGAAQAGGTGSSAGTGAASGTGSGLVGGTGSAAGTSTVSGTGATLAAGAGTGTAAGTSAATATGASLVGATGTAAGSATVVGGSVAPQSQSSGGGFGGVPLHSAPSRGHKRKRKATDEPPTVTKSAEPSKLEAATAEVFGPVADGAAVASQDGDEDEDLALFFLLAA